MRVDSFEHLYIDELNDLYSAETQLIKALPMMAEAATNPQLQQAFTNHLQETKAHAEIVKQLLSAMGEKAGGEKCKGMAGLIQEGGKLLDDLDDLRNGGARPDVPLIVLSGTDVASAQMMFQPEEWIREQIRGSERLFDAIAAAAPRGQHRSLPDASHATIPMARPDAVATAVRELLAQAH